MEHFKHPRRLELIDDILMSAGHFNTNEVVCRCRDGLVGFSKFYLGLLSPVLFRILNDTVYSALGEVTLLLPDYSVTELEQLRNLPLEGQLQGRPSASLLETLSIVERYRRTRDKKASPRPSPHISPLNRKTVAFAAATKPLSNCCDYVPDIYSLELFEPDYYVEDCDIQNEEDLSLTIHSSDNSEIMHGAVHVAKKTKRTKLCKSKISVGRANEPGSDDKIGLEISNTDEQPPKQPVKKEVPPDSGRRVPCNHCSTVFASEEALQTHMLCHQRTTAAAGSRNFGCLTCGKSFKKSFQLENHQRVHSGDRPFVCHTCGKCFNQEATLRTHMRIHSGSKPHTCKECGESFVTSFALVSHLQWRHNEGTRPFLCSFCSKAFPTKQALSKHETIHRVEKKYGCGHCEKKFSRSDHLKSHMRTHQSQAMTSIEGGETAA